MNTGRAILRAGASANRSLEIEKVASLTPEQAGMLQSLDLDFVQFSEMAPYLQVESANRADGILSNSPLSELAAQFNNPGKAPGPLVISKDKWTTLLSDVSATTAENGWAASFALELGRTVNYLKSSKAAKISPTRRRVLAAKFLIAEYMEAYFRNGQIIKLDFDIPNIKSKLIAELKKNKVPDSVITASTDEINQLSSNYLDELCKNSKTSDGACTLLGVIGDTTFVTRAGKSYGFPGITATVDLVAGRKISTNKINVNDTVTDVIRVAAEGLGDIMYGVPGAANSTFCNEVTRPGSCAVGQEKVFSQVNTAGDKAESATLSAMGIAIRGSWFVSLNNDLLADSISTGVAVTARKAAEAAVWNVSQHCSAALSGRGPMYRSFTLQLTQEAVATP
jgi:hypothetical protein